MFPERPPHASELTGDQLGRIVTIKSEKELGGLAVGPEWSVRGVLDGVSHRRGDNGTSVLLTLLVESGPGRQSITLEVEPTTIVELHRR